ncbi:Scramblase-domain-containing protein [Umbelopsis sp. PMI_123]|nr:Scramblase-domain-containing protein [Umbelopsis sp. PMI_123]
MLRTTRVLGPALRAYARTEVTRTVRTYSSLRRQRQAGPRQRIHNHQPLARPQRVAAASEPLNAPGEDKSTSHSEPLIEHDAKLSEDAAATEVSIPTPSEAVVTPDYKGALVLSQPALVIGRQIEMMNVFLGFEQANKYSIMDPNGNYVGFIAEEDSLTSTMSRQLLRTHRKFNATIMNSEGEVVFKITRPYSLINSRIFIHTIDDELIGEVQQRWHMLRRKYDLFVGKTQFATIDTPFLGWDFDLRDEQGQLIGNVNRNFVGFARELFTDTGQYVLRMDAVEGNSRGLTLDERAVALACAVSIDFDFFSRHSSHGGGGFFPFPFFGYGGDEARDDTKEVPPAPDSTPPPPPSQQPPSSSDTGYGDVWAEESVESPDDEDQGFLSQWRNLTGGDGGDDDEWF